MPPISPNRFTDDVELYIGRGLYWSYIIAIKEEGIRIKSVG